eukprot:TRINITY_DN121376_c0_g1_i1.p1 TRINITY_DN121376_c0_g1~~TRINITY_DN121376_c0_g1_i1.p1  ORF type:complete len:708 (-),score=164.13 TRINITY_DN121376_c0_g1_i1:103-2226(-)
MAAAVASPSPLPRLPTDGAGVGKTPSKKKVVLRKTTQKPESDTTGDLNRPNVGPPRKVVAKRKLKKGCSGSGEKLGAEDDDVRSNVTASGEPGRTSLRSDATFLSKKSAEAPVAQEGENVSLLKNSVSPASTQASEQLKSAELPSAPESAPPSPPRSAPAPTVGVRFSEPHQHQGSDEDSVDADVDDGWESDGGCGTLVLPDLTGLDIRSKLRDKSESVSYLDVAFAIVDDMMAEGSPCGDRLGFLRCCLSSGHSVTQLPCHLEEHQRNDPIVKGIRKTFMGKVQSETSSAPMQKQKSDRDVKQRTKFFWKVKPERGAMRAVRQMSRSGHRLSLQPVAEPEEVRPMAQAPPAPPAGCPWLGAFVPRWPSPAFEGLAPQLEKALSVEFSLWTFDIFKFAALLKSGPKQPLQLLGWEAMCRCGLFSEFSLNPEKTGAFLKAAEDLYEDARYHNNLHAADTVQTCFAFIESFGVGAFLDPMDMLGIIFSAVIHDLGHDGRNNAFHIGTQSVIALTYNDRSPQENASVSKAFSLIAGKDELNLVEAFGAEQKKAFRKEVIDMVLSTDMACHFSVLGEFHTACQKNGRFPADWHRDEKSISLLRETVLHAADLSNPSKGVNCCQEWTMRCLDEFFAQGDMEKSLRLAVSPLCDRNTTNIAASQLGFIDFVVSPTYAAVAEIAPKVKEVCLATLTVNRQMWELRKKQDEKEGS